MTSPGFMANQAAQQAAARANTAAQQAAQQAASQAIRAHQQAAELSRNAVQRAHHQSMRAASAHRAQAGYRPAGGVIGRVVRFLLGLAVFSAIVVVLLIVLGVDPGAFGAIVEWLRRRF